MDQVGLKLQAMAWKYADRDPDAFAELEERIADAGRAQQLITYSDLARDVEFNLDNVERSPFTIDVHAWDDFDRQVIGDFLGAIAARSYLSHGFLASALVVSAHDGTPGAGFVALLKQVGLVRRTSGLEPLEVWTRHVQLAFEHFADEGPSLPEPRTCPACGARALPVLFGEPSLYAQMAADRGEVVLGGCLRLTPLPTVECPSGHAFGIDADGTLLPLTDGA